MRTICAIVESSALVLILLGDSLVVRLLAAQEPSSETREGTADGGWSGPCEDWWRDSQFSFNAMRVCRVTTYLVRSLGKVTNEAEARAIANRSFRMCWGNFPRAQGNCNSENAWAHIGSWKSSPVQRPIVITVRASELFQSDDEMASVLAHEMGHAVDFGGEGASGLNGAWNLEQRADVAAIGFVMMAGYDARAAGRGLQMLGRERGQGLLGNVVGILSNQLHQLLIQDQHGYTQDRIALMKAVYAKGCAGLNNRPLGCKEGWK